MSNILSSRPHSNIPGDTRRELTESATSVDGREWPRGTVYQPLYAAAAEQVVTIKGERVSFEVSR